MIEVLQKIYQLQVSRNAKRLPYIEAYLGMSDPVDVTLDDLRNEHRYYALMAEQQGQTIEQLLRRLLLKLRTGQSVESESVLDAIEFVQGVIADILWRYHHELPRRLERFARQYDRLDRHEERERLRGEVNHSSSLLE
jgi:hypothetical protein